jgi:hypothetical protein
MSDQESVELDEEALGGGRGSLGGADRSHNAAVAGGGGTEGKMWFDCASCRGAGTVRGARHGMISKPFKPGATKSGGGAGYSI